MSRIIRTFNFCCTRLLFNQYKIYLETGKKVSKMILNCTSECGRDFKLGEFSAKHDCFFFNYNNYWYMYNTKDNSIDAFFPAIGVFDRDSKTFAHNLCREGLISKAGVKLLFGEVNQEEYVSLAMLHMKMDKNDILQDFNLINKFRIWHNLNVEKINKVNHYKQMAVNLINGTA